MSVGSVWNVMSVGSECGVVSVSVGSECGVVSVNVGSECV